MTGITQLLNHKRSSVVVIALASGFVAEYMGVLQELTEPQLYCGTALVGLFVVSQTVLDAIRIIKYGPNGDDPPNG